MFMLRRHRVFPLLLILGAGSVLFAGCRHCGRGDPRQRADKLVDKLQGKLDLTPDQTVQVRKLAHEIADTLGAFRGMHEGLHGDFLAQLRAATVDTAALNDTLSRREARFHETRLFLVGKFAEFHALLTPAQREKLADYLEKHKRGHCHGGW